MRASSRRCELGAGLHARNGALERDAIERRMLEHERTEAVQAQVDEIGHRVVRLLERADPLEQELEGSLRDRVDEEAVLRSEDAVDGPGRGASLARDSADGEGCGTTTLDEALCSGSQRSARVVVVLLRPSHG